MTEMKPYPHCLDNCRFIILKLGESPGVRCGYREMHVPTIAVDFDRVLFTHESWQGHFHVGDPIPGAIEALNQFHEMGFKIMIWTTRAQKDIIANACNNAKIPYDYINENPNQPPEINPSKPVADYYIDDRAVTFRSWPETVMEIKHRENHDPYYAAKKGEGQTSLEAKKAQIEILDKLIRYSCVECIANAPKKEVND
jgi:hypothetical protein